MRKFQREGMDVALGGVAFKQGPARVRTFLDDLQVREKLMGVVATARIPLSNARA
jgi:hypothetical protein